MFANKRFAALCLVIALLVSLSSGIATAQDEMLEAHKAAVELVVAEVFNIGNVDVIDTVYAADAVTHDADGTSYTGTEEFKASIPALRAAMPDFQAELDLLIAEGDYVAFRMHMMGTFENELALDAEMVVPPTGQPVSLHVNIVVRFNEEGMVVEEWDGYDNVSFLMQLGLFPMPEGAEAPMVDEPMANEMAGTGMEADHKAAVMAVFDLINAGDLDGTAAYLAPDYTHRNPGGVTTDLEAWKANIGGFQAALPDMTLTSGAMVAEGDYVMTVFTITGTHTADMMMPDGSTLPPTNAGIELHAVMLTHFNADGMADGSWEEFDQLTFLTQLGLLSME